MAGTTHGWGRGACKHALGTTPHGIFWWWHAYAYRVEELRAQYRSSAHGADAGASACSLDAWCSASNTTLCRSVCRSRPCALTQANHVCPIACTRLQDACGATWTWVTQPQKPCRQEQLASCTLLSALRSEPHRSSPTAHAVAVVVDLAWQLQLLQLQPNVTLTLRNLYFRSAFLLQDHLHPALADAHLPGTRIVQKDIVYSTTCSALQLYMCVAPRRVDARVRPCWCLTRASA